jgi:hypothetical protein
VNRSHELTARASVQQAADVAGGSVEPPMAYRHTYGPAVDPITRLGWGLGIISLLVIVIIGVLLLGGILRKRTAPSAADPRQLTVRRDAGGMAWIYVGGGISSVVLDRLHDMDADRYGSRDHTHQVAPALTCRSLLRSGGGVCVI